jgi:DNA-binding PadR family transcriptional regulator
MNVTTLDALLLFLVTHKGQSGYDVRQLMQSTPLGLFSDSPGAIYPALARLEQRGLLASAAEREGRRKRIYEHTDVGEAALAAWLVRPVDRDDVQRRSEELTLRFVMTAERLGRAAATAFLRDCIAVEAAHLAEIEAYRDGPGRDSSRASRQAVDLGVRLLRERLAWRQELLASEGQDDET